MHFTHVLIFVQHDTVQCTHDFICVQHDTVQCTHVLICVQHDTVQCTFLICVQHDTVQCTFFDMCTTCYSTMYTCMIQQHHQYLIKYEHAYFQEDVYMGVWVGT